LQVGLQLGERFWGFSPRRWDTIHWLLPNLARRSRVKFHIDRAIFEDFWSQNTKIPNFANLFAT